MPRTIIVRDAEQFRLVCREARSGDVIEMVPGDYSSPNRVPVLLGGERNAKGKIERLEGITIRAAAPGVIRGGSVPRATDGSGTPDKDGPGKPRIDYYGLLSVRWCDGLVIEGLEVEGFWPTIFYIEDCSNVVVRDCRLRDATTAIYLYAKNQFDKGGRRLFDTKGFLIERNTWQQDTSPGHDLWSVIDWAEAHGGEQSNGRYRYFNGAFVGGAQIDGDVIVRDNTIMDAYNGVRLRGREVAGPDGKRGNTNVHVYRNRFIRVRDNPIELETYASDWHVRHNTLVDCHSWYSVDGCTGGHWYFYGDTGRFTSVQGGESQRHKVGRVLKLSYASDTPGTARVPTEPWYVFNNSWYLRCPLIGGFDPALAPPGVWEGPDITAHLRFFNNAIQWCARATHGGDACRDIEMVRLFDWTNSRDVLFDHDISNKADFPATLRIGGPEQERNGIVATRPVFKAAAEGDFRLADDSQALHVGRRTTLARPGGSSILLGVQPSGRLDKGARQGDLLVSLPAMEQEAEDLAGAILAAARGHAAIPSA